MRLALFFLAFGITASATLPKLVQRTQPEYTREAIEAKLQGSVILTAVVGPDGLTSDIKIVRRLGLGLDEKAVECLRQWRFSPGQRDGEPIPVRTRVEIRFRLPTPDPRTVH